MIRTITLNEKIFYSLDDIEAIIGEKLKVYPRYTRRQLLDNRKKKVKEIILNPSIKPLDDNSFFILLKSLFNTQFNNGEILLDNILEINRYSFNIKYQYKDNFTFTFKQSLMECLLKDMPIDEAVDLAFKEVQMMFDVDTFTAESILEIGSRIDRDIAPILSISDIAHYYGATRAQVTSCLIDLGMVAKDDNSRKILLTKVGQKYGVKEVNSIYFVREVLVYLDNLIEEYVLFEKAKKSIYNKKGLPD